MVYSFEPNPDSYRLLVVNVKEQGNVCTFNVTLGSENDSMELNFKTEADGNAPKIRLPLHQNLIIIPLTTLDLKPID